MKDLDTMIGAGSYFGHPFGRQSLNRRAIYRAIEALDGEVRLVWKW